MEKEKKIDLDKAIEKDNEEIYEIEKEVVNIAGDIPKIPGDLSYLI